ncbi:MAG: hypothetical protein ACI9ES_000456 [Oceanospirillaceae bacterium]|jgi:hypothetical protein
MSLKDYFLEKLLPCYVSKRGGFNILPECFLTIIQAYSQGQALSETRI